MLVHFRCEFVVVSEHHDTPGLDYPFGNANAIHHTVVRTRRRNVRGERLREALGGAAREQRVDGKEKEEEEGGGGGGKTRDPHSRRLSCSPSAYHGVRGQDLYVEFIVAESALLRFMDVFRRSAAARVIYRGTLALPASPSRSVTELFSLFLSLSLPVVLSILLIPSAALIRYTRVAPRETEGFLMNATTESLFPSLSLTSLLFSISRRLSLPFSLSLFTTLPLHSLSL